MTNFKKVTHCIFDMDGLLLDTECLYTLVINRILNKYGKEFTWEHKSVTMGFHTRKLTQYLVDTFELPLTPEEVTTQLQKAYVEVFPSAQLLPDSETIYKKIYDTICSTYGHKYGGDLAFQVLGRPELVGAQLIIDHYKLPLTVTEFQDVYHQLQQKYFTSVNTMPGADQLLHHLKTNNIPLALATSSSSESYELKTKNWKMLFDLFHHRVLGGSDPEVKNGKPSPDIFLVAASRFDEKPDPSSCLVFEDAPNGVQAAVSAGMQVVMVPDPNLPESYTTKATQVLKSLQDFKPEQFGLPKWN